MKSYFSIVCFAALLGFAFGNVDTSTPNTSTTPLFCGCFFNGRRYPVGTVINRTCVTMICRQGRSSYEWYTDNRIERRCDQCKSQNDPHFVTFDLLHDSPPGYYFYDWHGVCRYSLVEHVQNWALGLSNPQPPQFAIYGQFRPCSRRPNSPPSCHSITSYQTTANWDDVVHVDHLNVMRIYDDSSSSLTINHGDPPIPVTFGSQQYGLLAWEYNGCLRLLGSDLLCQICRWGVRVWTPRRNLNCLGGLCGKYNHNWRDDQTERDNTPHTWITYPGEFPVSWRVPPHLQFQAKCKCPPTTSQINALVRQSQIPCRFQNAYNSRCRNSLRNCRAPPRIIEQLTRMCAADLCFFKGDRVAQSTWIRSAQDVCDEETTLNRPNTTTTTATAPTTSSTTATTTTTTTTTNTTNATSTTTTTPIVSTSPRGISSP